MAILHQQIVNGEIRIKNGLADDCGIGEVSAEAGGEEFDDVYEAPPSQGRSVGVAFPPARCRSVRFTPPTIPIKERAL